VAATQLEDAGLKPSTAGRVPAPRVVGAAACNAVARVAGAGKTALITFFFRPGAALDAYLLAFLIVSTVTDAFFGSLSSVLVPALVEEEAEERGAYPAALLACVAGSLGLALLAVCVVYATQFQRRDLLLLMIPMLPLTAVGAVWRSVLNARHMFVPSSFSFVLTPVVASITLLAAHSRGVEALAIGSTLGVLAEAMFLAGFLVRSGIPVFPVARSADFSALRASRQYASVVASGLIGKGALIVDQTFAAWSGVGGLSILNFGTRLTGVLVAVGPGALGTALLPQFSRSLQRNGAGDTRRMLVRTLLISMSVMGMVSAALILFSTPVVRLAFSHGALTGGDLARVAAAQRWSLLQAPFSVGLAIVLPLIASLRANHIAVPLWSGALAAHAALDYMVIGRYGVTGVIGVSAAVEATVLGCALVIVFRRLIRHDLRHV
jgi:putative peptidoglycan lipid II flippase